MSFIIRSFGKELLLKYVKLTTIGEVVVLYKLEMNVKMKNTMKIKKEVIDNRPKYKLQVDTRTTITVRTMGALKAWQEKYPEAKLVD